MTTTDERASILAVIVQEQTTIEHYQALLETNAPHAQKVRWQALMEKHAGYIKKWQAELTT